MFEGDRINGLECSDEEDLSAAPRSSTSSRPVADTPGGKRQTRAYARLRRYFAKRDQAAITENLSDRYSQDDRRRVVGGGIRHGRECFDRGFACDGRPRVENHDRDVDYDCRPRGNAVLRLVPDLWIKRHLEPEEFYVCSYR